MNASGAGIWGENHRKHPAVGAAKVGKGSSRKNLVRLDALKNVEFMGALPSLPLQTPRNGNEVNESQASVKLQKHLVLSVRPETC